MVETRKQYSDIYLTELKLPHQAEPQIVIFRALNQAEFDNFAQSAAHGDVTEDVIRAAVLYPSTPWLESPVLRSLPGSFDALAHLIVSLSGFQDPKAYQEGMNYSNELSSTLTSAIQIFICKAFPRYAPKEVSAMGMMEQLTLLGQAQHILGTEFPMKQFFEKQKPIKDKSPIDWDNINIFSASEIEMMKSSAHYEAHRNRVESRKQEKAMEAKLEKESRIEEIRQKAMARRKS